MVMFPTYWCTNMFDNTIIKHISAVVVRNKDYWHSVLGFGDLRKYTDDIKRVLVSSLQRTRFLLFPHHLQAIVRWDAGADRTGLRNACIIMIGTVGACRKSELVELDVCDWVEGRDRSGVTGASLGAAIHIRFIRRPRNNISSINNSSSSSNSSSTETAAAAEGTTCVQQRLSQMHGIP